MRIRATVLTPILAILTVAAIISTGMVLGQERHGQADATLLGPTPVFASSASEAIAVVADAETTGDAGAWTRQSADQTTPVVEPAPDTPGTATGGDGSLSRPAPTTRPTTTEHSARRTITTVQSEKDVQPADVHPADDDAEHAGSDDSLTSVDD